ncbi:MAG: hypothetical protein HZB46_04580 [Solirubrobacterales bacterium]|nr:hypothetical protein [Solirubrobacterales bacterium]
MALLAAVLVLSAVALLGCGKDEPPLPLACRDADAAAFERALRGAPRAVALEDGTAISECLRRVRNDAQLQNLGLVLSRVADRLAVRARDADDPAAAAQLGFLVGAARRGAERSNGISSELARRLERAGLKLDGTRAALADALQTGLEAGQARG